jgi:hypothetical protein
MNTNIQNLGALVDNINVKMQALERRIDNLQVVGGRGINASRDENKYYVELEDLASNPSEPHPWALSWIKDPLNEKRVIWSCYLGAINGFYGQTNDYKDFHTERIDADEFTWVYLDISTSGAFLHDLKIKTHKGKIQPDMQRAYSKNAFPNKFLLIIGIIQGNRILYQLLKNDIRILPEEVFTETEDGVQNTYYAWNYVYL